MYWDVSDKKGAVAQHHGECCAGLYYLRPEKDKGATVLQREEIRERKKVSIGGLTILTLFVIVLVIAGIVSIMRSVGKSHLTTAVAGTGDELITIGEPIPEDASQELQLKEGQILYENGIYELNKDLITILVMGIDKETVTEIGGQSWTEEEGSLYAGGQADALFLMLLDPHTKKISIVAINRNTMCLLDVFDEQGNYKGQSIQQIALQHGYGDGGAESCERQAKAVSRLFHGIPIHSYAAISMDAIPELNDAVGGITVEVLDDIVYPEFDMNLHQGETVTLYGEKAYWYVRLRNENVFNSNALRLQRQKQYLTTFAATAKNMATKDIRVAVDLYNTVQKYMVTDIDINSFTYLATESVNYDFNIDNMYALEGETLQGNKFEEFYPDEEALERLIIDLFYEPVG